MPLPLIEAAKRAAMQGRVFDAAVALQYAKASPILGVLPFRTIKGNALSYNREERLPGVGFRGINEAYPESTGVYNPQTETLAIAGGDLDVDLSIIRTFGEAGTRETEEAQKLRALSLSWTATFFRGDTTQEPRSFDGLQRRLTGSQLIAAGNTSGGDPLSLTMLDRLKARVRDATHYIMGMDLYLRLCAAARNPNVSGYVVWMPDQFGRQIMQYNGLPVLAIEEDNNASAILGFSEAQPGGGAPASTSVYCVSLTDGMLFGIQNMEPTAYDLGHLQTKPAMRTRVEWEAGICIKDGRAAARLWGVRDAAVVA